MYDIVLYDDGSSTGDVLVSALSSQIGFQKPSTGHGKDAAHRYKGYTRRRTFPCHHACSNK